MEELRKYLYGNWFWIFIGLILTEEAVKTTYIERNYIAYGGEWLVLPLILMAVELVRNICNAARYLSGLEEDL
ncbi:MAG: hypothetical protein K1W24_07090 [Lachnospiraceae bacterium]